MTAGTTVADELRTRGHSLIRMGHEMLRSAEADGTDVTGPAALDSKGAVLLLAKAVLDERRRRERYFRSDLFGEPGWHILLDLFIHQCVGARVSVTAACIGSGAPTTTALRYLNLLIDDGLVAREGDASDGRRSWLTLSPQAMEAMTGFLAAGLVRGFPGTAAVDAFAHDLT